MSNALTPFIDQVQLADCEPRRDSNQSFICSVAAMILTTSETRYSVEISVVPNDTSLALIISIIHSGKVVACLSCDSDAVSGGSDCS